MLAFSLLCVVVPGLAEGELVNCDEMGVGIGSSTFGCVSSVFSGPRLPLLRTTGAIIRLWESLAGDVCVCLVSSECSRGPSQPARMEWQVAEAQGILGFLSLKPQGKEGGRIESRAAPPLGPIPAALPQPSALVQSSGHAEAKWSSRLRFPGHIFREGHLLSPGPAQGLDYPQGQPGAACPF